MAFDVNLDDLNCFTITSTGNTYFTNFEMVGSFTGNILSFDNQGFGVGVPNGAVGKVVLDNTSIDLMPCTATADDVIVYADYTRTEIR